MVTPTSSTQVPMPSHPSAPPPHVLLTWRDVSYHVPGIGRAEKTLLHAVSGYVRSGDMLAILGPSGAGKTTLLNVLAQRKGGSSCHGRMEGEVLVNGVPIDANDFKRFSGYVQQEDLLHSYVTVEETVTFAATLRTLPSVSNAEIYSRVQRVLQLLGIEHVRGRLVGGATVQGISGGEKKRCAIAAELVTTPALLFLDEPTTGLDTFTAQHLLSLLRSMAASGMAVVFSIHQPRASVYRLFDKVLLLNGMGEEAFFGPAADAVPFFQGIGIVTGDVANPADFLMDAVSALEADEQLLLSCAPVVSDSAAFSFYVPPPTQAGDIAAAFRTMKLPSILAELDALALDSGGHPLRSDATSGRLSRPYFRGTWTQIRAVAGRCFRNKLRDPVATVVSITVSLIFALLIGSMYFRVGNAQASIRNRMGALFFITMITTFSSLGSLELFLADRSIYSREHRNGMYSAAAYYVGKVLQDVPVGVAVNVAFSTILYYMIGFQWDLTKFGLFALVSVLLMLNSYAMCLFVSNLSRNYAVANIVASLTLVLYLLPSGGMLTSLDSIPFVWRWIKYVSFVRYGFAALVIGEFDGLTFTCDDSPGADLFPCITSGKVYAASQGFYAEDLGKYVGFTAASILVYWLLGFMLLVLWRSDE